MIDALLAKIVSRDGGSLLFSGEPGIGKSHLLREVVARAKHLSIRTISLRCSESDINEPFALLSRLGALFDIPEPASFQSDTTRFRFGRQALDAAAEHPTIILIDDLQYGTQFGQISAAFTITVPLPKKENALTTNLSNEPLQYETEREFTGSSASGAPLGWWVEGPCQLVRQDGPKFWLRANAVDSDCVVKANTEEDATWERGYLEVRIRMIKKVETVSLTGTVSQGLEYKKEMVLTAEGNSNRPVSWFLDGNCVLVEARDRWARVRANDGQGNCKVEARLYENEWFTGASAAVYQGMVIQKEAVTIVGKAQIWHGRTISLRYETLSGRIPVFKTTGMCRVVKVTGTHLHVASRFTFGKCVISTTLAATRAEGGASGTTRVNVLTLRQQRQAELFED
jgi:hypothetical protein